VLEGKTPIQPIPERRPLEKQARAYVGSEAVDTIKPSEGTASFVEKPSEIKMRM